MSTYVDYDSHGIVGFTDLVSNTVVLDDISPLSRTSQLVSGTLDLSFLPGVAHEAAHHVCFDSPVGLALCSLWQSSFTLWWEQIGTDVPQQPARDLVLASIANIVLQPLLEGLALFSEHNLITGASPVISGVTQRVAPLFSAGRILPLLAADKSVFRALVSQGRDATFSAGHTAVLRLARSSLEWAERKSLLLSQPLKGPNRYLLGYLAVKGMYAALVSVCAEFADPELFFVAVVRHFLHDARLAEILCRFRNKSDGSKAAYLIIASDINDFVTRFQDLCDELFNKPAQVANAAVKSVLSAPRTESLLFGSNELFMGLRTVGTMNVAWPHLMKHRQAFRFSFQPVIIRLTPDGQATVRDDAGKDIVQVLATQGCRPTDWDRNKADIEFEGSIEAIQFSDFRTLVIAILGHDGLVAVFDCQSRQWNTEHLVEMLDDMPSSIAVEGAMYAFAEWHSRTKGRDNVRQLVDSYEAQAGQMVDHLYPQLACRGPGRNNRNQFIEKLGEQGVLSLYEERDQGLVARLSLVIGLFNSLEYAAASLELAVDELAATVARLNHRCEKTCGFEPFLLKEEFVVSRI